MLFIFIRSVKVWFRTTLLFAIVAVSINVHQAIQVRVVLKLTDIPLIVVVWSINALSGLNAYKQPVPSVFQLHLALHLLLYLSFYFLYIILFILKFKNFICPPAIASFFLQYTLSDVLVQSKGNS